MSSITQLPSGVWVQIFSYTTLESFRNISLTCKCLREHSQETQELSGRFLAATLSNTKWAPATLQQIQLTTENMTGTDAIDILKETVKKARGLWKSFSPLDREDLQETSPQRICLYQSIVSFNKLLMLEDEQRLLRFAAKAKSTKRQCRNILFSLRQPLLHREKIAALARLPELIISSPINEKALPISIGNLSSLLNLSVADKELTSIPDSIGKLTRLEELDLGHNDLQNVPETIGNLPCLQILYLCGNKIETVPDSLGTLTALTILYLNKNNLKTIPSLEHLTSLESLYLQENGLSSLPISIGNLGLLKVLNLGGNSLRLLPDTIIGCTRLEDLNLENNQLEKLPSRLDSLSLKLLNISGNPVLETDEESIQMLKRLYVEKRCRIICDQNMKRLTGIA